ncbi:MAG: hypothetical protein Q7T50_01355, partial [Candidatus Magasanikbacteria bacterium]|nr:hypothetical protein [Candidatus Magasanikbacteria bacterium]
EIFEKVDQELRKIERSGMLPGGVFLIGGGTRLRDITEVAKRQLRLPVCLGVNKKARAIIDKVNETEFLNALGLVIWGSQVSEGAVSKGFKMPGGESMDKSIKKMKKWFSSLVP